MNAESVKSVQVIVYSEIKASLLVNFGARKTPTCAMVSIETGDDTVLTDVHNVPEDILDEFAREGRVERVVVIGACETEKGPASVLKRVTIGKVEYFLKP